MKLPRNVTGERLARVLERIGYERIGQRGSHLHMMTRDHGEHHVVVPIHRPIKVGTLSSIIRDIADHQGLSRDELLHRLDL